MKPTLNKENFYAQFPRNEEHVMAAEGYERPDWHTLMEGLPEQHTGQPFHFKRGGAVHRPHHIPGLHINTAEVGEPTFTGKL